MKDSFLSNIEGKSSNFKQKILGLCVNAGDYSIAELSKELNVSIPTITRLVGELIEDGFLEDLGKMGTSGGRRPSIYGLNPSAGYIVGTDVRRNHISVAIINFKGNIIDCREDIPFSLRSTEESFRELCGFLTDYLGKMGIDSEQVLAYGINLSGRVNRNTGYSFRIS